jgi:hypothetical protein
MLLLWTGDGFAERGIDGHVGGSTPRCIDATNAPAIAAAARSGRGVVLCQGAPGTPTERVVDFGQEAAAARALSERLRAEARASDARQAELQQQLTRDIGRLNSRAASVASGAGGAGGAGGGQCLSGPRCDALQARAQSHISRLQGNSNEGVPSQSMLVFCVNMLAAEVANRCGQEQEQLGHGSCARLAYQQAAANLETARAAAATFRQTSVTLWQARCGWNN